MDLPIIINNLETKKDIDDYKTWLANKNLNSIKRIKRMLEIDKKHQPDRWKNIDLRIELIENEIQSREGKKYER